MTSKPDHDCCRNLDNEIVIVLFKLGFTPLKAGQPLKATKL